MAKITLTTLLQRAETKALALVAILGGVLKVPLILALWNGLASSATTLFGGLAIAAFTIAPRVSFLPEQPLVVVALLVGTIAAGRKLWKGTRSMINRYQENTS